MKVQEGHFLEQVSQQQHCCSLGSDTQYFVVVVDLCFVVLSCFPCSTHWLQVAPLLRQPSVTPMWPNAPWRAQSLPTENHWLNISLVTGRGGLWNRCVTPRARPSFLVTPATFRRMKKQGRRSDALEISSVSTGSKESQWGPQKTVGAWLHHLLQPVFLKMWSFSRSRIGEISLWSWHTHQWEATHALTSVMYISIRQLELPNVSRVLQQGFDTPCDLCPRLLSHQLIRNWSHKRRKRRCI